MLSLADHLGRLGQGEDGTGGDLDNLLENDIARNLVARDVVALGDLVGGVEAVLREQVVDVDGVEEQGEDPVDDDGDDEGQPEVGQPRDEVGLLLEGVFWERREGGFEERVVRHARDGGDGLVAHDESILIGGWWFSFEF